MVELELEVTDSRVYSTKRTKVSIAREILILILLDVGIG